MSKIASLEDVDESPSPARTDTQTRQKSSAAVQTIDPAAVIAILDQWRRHRRQLISSSSDSSWHHWDGQLISLGWRYGTIQFSFCIGCRNSASPVLIQAEGLETAAWCTWWSPGPWTGPATPEVQWSVAWDRQTFVTTHYYILYYIITLTIITYSYILYFYIIFIIITHYYIGYYYVLWQNHCYCNITYYHIIITTLIQYYYINNIIT